MLISKSRVLLQRRALEEKLRHVRVIAEHELTYDKVHVGCTVVLKKSTDEAEKAAIEAAESIYTYADEHPELQERLMVAKQFQYLTYLVYEGAKVRYGEQIEESIVKRIDYELSVIETWVSRATSLSCGTTFVLLASWACR